MSTPGTDAHTSESLGQVPRLEPWFSTNTNQKTICIVGAGPAGLASLKAVLDTDLYKSSAWVPLVFEAREDVGGIWFPSEPDTIDPPLTPLYDCLTTNLPHPIMSFQSFPFPPETPLFPVAERVHQYFKDFARHFSLREHIKFSTRVVSVSYTPDRVRRWLVKTSMNDSYYFDLIMVCNGHHRMPRFPTIPGLSAWQNADKICHAAYYRRPIPHYQGQTLLIVGSGPSGHDLALDLKGHASKIIFSGSNFKYSTTSDGVHLRPRLVSFDCPGTGTVKFADGSVEEGVDHCILATGYQFDFPFLDQALIRVGRPPAIPPLPQELYNASYGTFPLASHIWPLQHQYPPETMPFIGVITRVTPPPLFEAQARAALRAFETYVRGADYGARGIDEQMEVADIVNRWERLKRELGDEGSVVMAWHKFEESESHDYRDHLSFFAETDPFESHVPSKENTGFVGGILKRIGLLNFNFGLWGHSTSTSMLGDNFLSQIRVQKWEKFGYAKKDILRKTWVEIERRGESGAWLKNVGTNGMEEWVDLMYRVVQRGEEFQDEAERNSFHVT